jgi:predicted  nucleic acid-binding Zn-ribbon protein
MLKKLLVVFLKIQELDMEMIQLTRLKQERTQELNNLQAINTDLYEQVMLKEREQEELKKAIRLSEGDVADVVAKLKKLEGQQVAVKKVDEFNALSQEISQAERERTAKEQRLSDMYDKLTAEEDVFTNLKSTLEKTQASSHQLEVEIRDRILQINAEGQTLQAERQALASEADPEVMRIYERLLRNKRDRVFVPIENRCCSGCHIMITAQDENLVRKGERLVFCEHCSRIHYWPESDMLEGTFAASKQRRRRTPKT